MERTYRTAMSDKARSVEGWAEVYPEERQICATETVEMAAWKSGLAGDSIHGELFLGSEKGFGRFIYKRYHIMCNRR